MQFLIDKRKQILGGLGIPVIHRLKQPGDFSGSRFHANGPASILLRTRWKCVCATRRKTVDRLYQRVGAAQALNGATEGRPIHLANVSENRAERPGSASSGWPNKGDVSTGSGS